MNPNYRKNPWSEVTRDERFFCAELFQIIKNNKHPFNQLLAEKGIINSVHTEYDIGYEVCFYRDFIFRYGYDNGFEESKNHHIRTIENLNVPAKVRVRERESKKIIIENRVLKRFPFKRTFDLCLFLESEIIIIEAKAQQGFKIDQLSSFDEDRELLKKLLGEHIKIQVVGLCSNYYSPKKDTAIFFNDIISWKEIYEIYPRQFNSLINADKSYTLNYEIK